LTFVTESRGHTRPCLGLLRNAADCTLLTLQHALRDPFMLSTSLPVQRCKYKRIRKRCRLRKAYQ